MATRTKPLPKFLQWLKERARHPWRGHVFLGTASRHCAAMASLNGYRTLTPPCGKARQWVEHFARSAIYRAELLLRAVDVSSLTTTSTPRRSLLSCHPIPSGDAALSAKRLGRPLGHLKQRRFTRQKRKPASLNDTSNQPMAASWPSPPPDHLATFRQVRSRRGHRKQTKELAFSVFPSFLFPFSLCWLSSFLPQLISGVFLSLLFQPLVLVLALLGWVGDRGLPPRSGILHGTAELNCPNGHYFDEFLGP